MNMQYEHELRGCTPEPLMAYLKALGIFRLVSEQKDRSARAWWQNDVFILRTTLDRAALLAFFLNEYRPTPIVSPWNGSGGFFSTSSPMSIRAVEAILANRCGRLDAYRQTIETAQGLLRQARISEKPSKTEKALFLKMCRSHLSDLAVPWLDAVYALTEEDPKYMPLLGTGANDGRMDFTCNFMTNLVPALTGVDIGKRPPRKVCPEERRAGWLNISAFGEGSGQLIKSAVGQFNPGGVGGPNATVGFEGDSLLNPWDFVLMMEGAVLFAGAAARRLSAQASSRASFPFVADSSMAVSGAFEYSEKSRAEFWAPLWDQPANLQELGHLMSEGRAQLGRRQGSSGTDFARAVVGLGTERGVAQFQRYGFLERHGRTYLAAPLGRFQVRSEGDISERANVLFDLNAWMDSLRRNLSSKNAPAELGAVLSKIDSAILAFCQQGDARYLQNVLIAVGHAERWISKSGLRKENDRGKGVRPLNSLSDGWLHHADDDSPEFRLARAMASIQQEVGQGRRKVGPIRENMEPVDTAGGRTRWKEDSVAFVWKAGDVLANMLAALARRCLEGRMHSLEKTHAPLRSAYPARLEDIAAFLEGTVDIGRVADLALPLSFVRFRTESRPDGPRADAVPTLPVAYAAMKLTLLPGTFRWQEYQVDAEIRMEPQMLTMLRTGRVGDAFSVARRRLWASGFRPLLDEPGIANRSKAGRLLAAALLFPLDQRAHDSLAECALWAPRETAPQLS